MNSASLIAGWRTPRDGSTSALRNHTGGLAHLPAGTSPQEDSTDGANESGPPGGDASEVESRIQRERLAFLLRLGVAEVPPVDSFDVRDQAGRAAFPWQGPVHARQLAEIGVPEGWTFGCADGEGRYHSKVWLAQDHRFRWSTTEMADRDPEAFGRCLELGERLYAQRSTCLVFCTGCNTAVASSHRSRHDSTPEDGYPSQISVQLRTDAWMHHLVAGEPADRPSPPQHLWWTATSPTPQTLPQSQYRFLPLVAPDTELVPAVSEPVASITGVRRIDRGTPEELLELHHDLRRRLESDEGASWRSGSARRALITLHRSVYERLAACVGDGDAPEWIDGFEILCLRGGQLAHVAVTEALHDDGSASSAVRHFAGALPLVVISPDHRSVARRLGIRDLHIDLTRQGEEPGVDVTDEVHRYVGDRAAELLAIMVNHSLGTEVMALDGTRFRDRATALAALRVHRVDDLVVEARVRDTDLRRLIGRGSDQDLHLDLTDPTRPVLFHDFHGSDWVDRFGGRVGTFLADLLEAPTYKATFTLFLQQDGPEQRDDHLRELGVMPDDVLAISALIGVADEAQQVRSAAWFSAVTEALGGTAPSDPNDTDSVRAALRAAGAGVDLVDHLVASGGGPGVRANPSEGSPLRLLHQHGLDLRLLHERLVAHGDEGLSIMAATRSLASWKRSYGHWCAAVLEMRSGVASPTTSLDDVAVPDTERYALDPDPVRLLAGVVELFAEHGIVVDAAALVAAPDAELARAAGLDDATQLDQLVRSSTGDDGLRDLEAARTARWREVVVRLGTIVATEPGQSGIRTRATESRTGAMVPSRPRRPEDLVGCLSDVFGANPELAGLLRERLTNPQLGGAPGLDEPSDLVLQFGVDLERADLVARALDRAARETIERTNREIDALRRAEIRPARPAGLVPRTAGPAPKPTPDPATTKKVAAIKVGERADRRKRELGDQGESWALSAIVADLLGRESSDRRSALTEMSQLLESFEGAVVDEVQGLLDELRTGTFDDDDLLVRLTRALRLSDFSDGFGFDLLGHLPAVPGQAPRAMCLEVKSSSGNGFHLSTAEWRTAELLHTRGQGSSYAVLVVRRPRGGGPPRSLDLLVDPVTLRDEGLLHLDPDGFVAAYSPRVGRSDGGATG